MITALEGILSFNNRKDYIVLNVNGIYFGINCTQTLISALPALGESTKVETYLNVKEDRISLIGFKDDVEKEFFKVLITIQGIGPKNAAAILNGAKVADFKAAIVNENAEFLSSIPGIGLKTAKRLIVELKDKMKNLTSPDIPTAALNSEYNTAFSGLVNLGCAPAQAAALLNFVVKQNAGKNLDAEQLLLNALKNRGTL